MHVLAGLYEHFSKQPLPWLQLVLCGIKDPSTDLPSQSASAGHSPDNATHQGPSLTKAPLI